MLQPRISGLLPLWLLVGVLNQGEAISPISVKGTKLYDEDGNQFFVKGLLSPPTDSTQDDEGLTDARGRLWL